VTAPPSGAPAVATRTALPYRPDIDGLRAVAVIMVIACHAFPGLLPGGFTGVDVFFVISGYLITGLVLAEMRAGGFTLLGFYQRRARRIVPALLLVLTVCFSVAWLTLLPGEFRWFGRSLLWSAPLLANVFFARVTGYFDPGAHYNLLLQLWSLGVEEQFYLLWPVLLILAVRADVTLRALIAVLATSFAISLWGAYAAPVVHFFLPGSRAWELALGALLAVAPLARHHWALPSSAAGVVLISVGALGLSAAEPFPGVWAAIPAGGAALLIGAGADGWVNRQLLATRAAVFIGRRSYSLYLWHWPLLVFGRVISGGALPAAGSVAVIALAFAAACATYRLVELPLRQGALGRAAFPALLAGLIAFTMLGSLTDRGRLPGRMSGPEFAPWEAAVRDWDISSGGTRTVHGDFDTLSVRSRRPATTLFIGDSHMQQYWPRIANLAATHPDSASSVLFTAYAGCPILPGLNSLRQPRDCDGFFSYATSQAFQPQVDTVVFGAFWELYLLEEFSLPQHQGVYRSGDLLRRRLQLDSPATAAALQRFAAVIARIVSSGRRVFIVLSNPTSPQFDPPALVPPRLRLGLEPPQLLYTDHARRVDAAAYEAFVAPLMTRLREIAARSGAQIIDPRLTLCDGMMCPAVAPDGTPLFIDSNHMRASFVREHASFLDPTLMAGARTPGT
jgi:peptidoglycan/LPS O-acetylase OafA/YrhL